MSWLKFERLEYYDGKNDAWTVGTRPKGAILGKVLWYSRWRKFAFYPVQGSGFDEDCLREIATFCEDQTKARKAMTKKRAA